MNKNIIACMAFVAGAAIGSFATRKLVKDKYKQYADEEIASVKEVFAKREETHLKDLDNLGGKLDGLKDTLKTEHNYTEKPDIKNYAKILNEEHYSEQKEEEVEPMKKGTQPYIIEPDEFGEMDGYETVSLTYYSDGVIEDENGAVMDDDEIEDAVGKDAVNHFGEYEDDSVFVRNDVYRCDYEILRDLNSYSNPQDSISDTENY